MHTEGKHRLSKINYLLFFGGAAGGGMELFDRVDAGGVTERLSMPESNEEW